MKQLHWDKLPPMKLPGTIWKKKELDLVLFSVSLFLFPDFSLVRSFFLSVTHPGIACFLSLQDVYKSTIDFTVFEELFGAKVEKAAPTGGKYQQFLCFVL